MRRIKELSDSPLIPKMDNREKSSIQEIEFEKPNR